MKAIDKETRLCISLAAKPGNFGNRFHNFLYEKLGLNFIYKGGTTDHLPHAIHGMRALGIRGCGLSMPFKEQVLPLLDDIDPVARSIGAVNTVVNNKGSLIGYNTDWMAVRELLIHRKIPLSSGVAVAGSGGMAKAVVKALGEVGFRSVTIVSRNQSTGEALAKGAQARWVAAAPELSQFDLLINATPMGMAGGPAALPFSEDMIKNALLVCDVVANPHQTPLIETARRLGKQTINGFEVTCVQAREQFRLYTGVSIPEELYQQALVFSSL